MRRASRTSGEDGVCRIDTSHRWRGACMMMREEGSGGRGVRKTVAEMETMGLWGCKMGLFEEEVGEAVSMRPIS